jgi:hypothetical protein
MSDLDRLELAWGIIANAGGGNWETQSPEWVKAAERWRDDYHARLQRWSPLRLFGWKPERRHA